jgi:hypothetical protein
MSLPQVVIDTNVIVAGVRSYNTRDFTGVEQFGLKLLEPSEFLRLIGKLL